MPFNLPHSIHTWQMSYIEKGKPERKLEAVEIPLPVLQAGQVLIEVAGCGVCGTDLSLFFDDVKPVSRLPLTLGHEISGTVVAGEEQWIGKRVIVPTIMPCNQCSLCKAGRSNRCLFQKMPGYSYGAYGGFSSHLVVPIADLCVIPADMVMDTAQLAVTADAVATPYQAAMRSKLGQGDKVIIIGVTGGLGIYMAQWAKVLGAAVVIGIGRNDTKLAAAAGYGPDLIINARDRSVLDIKGDIVSFCRKNHIDFKSGWKIYEMTGTPEGQRLGLELLMYTSTLVIVGYGIWEISYNFSRLMAFDSEVMGSWGCKPCYYPAILGKVLDGSIDTGSLVETRPLSRIVETFHELRRGRDSLKRIVLVPGF